jgi:hypothetical protein
MGKFYGKIGYADTVENPPDSGVWRSEITERFYYGEIGRSSRRLQTAGQVNDDIVISNEISIVADKFAYDQFHKMKYVEYLGVKWKIANVEIQPPRLILTTGGVYNG